MFVESCSVCLFVAGLFHSARCRQNFLSQLSDSVVRIDGPRSGFLSGTAVRKQHTVWRTVRGNLNSGLFRAVAVSKAASQPRDHTVEQVLSVFSTQDLCVVMGSSGRNLALSWHRVLCVLVHLLGATWVFARLWTPVNTTRSAGGSGPSESLLPFFGGTHLEVGRLFLAQQNTGARVSCSGSFSLALPHSDDFLHQFLRVGYRLVAWRPGLGSTHS